MQWKKEKLQYESENENDHIKMTNSRYGMLWTLKYLNNIWQPDKRDQVTGCTFTSIIYYYRIGNILFKIQNWTLELSSRLQSVENWKKFELCNKMLAQKKEKKVKYNYKGVGAFKINDASYTLDFNYTTF